LLATFLVLLLLHLLYCFTLYCFVLFCITNDFFVVLRASILTFQHFHCAWLMKFMCIYFYRGVHSCVTGRNSDFSTTLSTHQTTSYHDSCIITREREREGERERGRERERVYLYVFIVEFICLAHKSDTTCNHK